MASAYDEINGFEGTLVAEGMILLKFWMHISDAEQKSRFERRAKDPLKSWKLTDEDWRNRAKRPLYEAATQLDEAYREEVVERIAEQMKETFARRAEYLTLVDGTQTM